MIKNVILDFGHGGVGTDGKYTTAPKKMYTFLDGTIAYEGVINREIGREIYKCLSLEDKINIICTVSPDNPEDISLLERVRIVNSYNPDETIFISIHCNASPNHNASGFEIYTTKGFTNSDYLANEITSSIEPTLREYGLKIRKDTSDGDVDKEVDFYVLRKTKCPAVLIECGFFDFRKDFETLKNPTFQGSFGSFIYTGILNYINGKN